MSVYRRIAALKTAHDFKSYAASLGAAIPFDDELDASPSAPLAQPLTVSNMQIGNRFAILPMEGWDGTADGRPSELTIRRWQRFGASGAKLIWGGEAAAVRHDGRANPNQLVINAATVAEIGSLRVALVEEHRQRYGATDDLLVGLQLTHSGRYARPNEKSRLEPKIIYNHPILDGRIPPTSPATLLSDEELDRLVDDFIVAAKLAQQAGFAFVDIKHCHAYLGHELLSAVDRQGRYGGSLENRTRFLRNIVAGIRAEAPGLHIGVRISAVDWYPFRPRENDRIGEPDAPADAREYRHAFGGDGTGRDIDLTETFAFLDILASLDVRLVCVTVGSPYYNPHRQRPAFFPPSDGYLPPEDPLVGVATHLDVTARMKAHRPDLLFVGSGYSYLQDWLPNVAQAVVRSGGADIVGLGRMALSYPELPADVIAGKPLLRKAICRTFSDCTTAPRNGIISGCFPLDPFYKAMPEAKQVASLKTSP